MVFDYLSFLFGEQAYGYATQYSRRIKAGILGAMVPSVILRSFSAKRPTGLINIISKAIDSGIAQEVNRVWYHGQWIRSRVIIRFYSLGQNGRNVAFFAWDGFGGIFARPKTN